MDVRDTVIEALRETLASQERVQVPGTLSDEMSLAALRVDSLAFGALVARLDDELGIDPFADTDEWTLPRTVGDLVALYEQRP